MVATPHPPLIEVMNEHLQELLHMDLVSPAHVRWVGGKWYVLVVVEDFSCYGSWLIRVRLLSLFEIWFWDRKMRDIVMRFDLYSVTMAWNSRIHFLIKTCYRDLGLKRQFATSYVPHLNGAMERKNRTLFEMAMTMLDEQLSIGLLRGFYVEVVNTTCHVSNQLFVWGFKKKTCYELMHGRSPNVSHFWVFGCKYFILKKGNLYKFESWSSDCIFSATQIIVEHTVCSIWMLAM
jgi:transposase InsO family protein